VTAVTADLTGHLLVAAPQLDDPNFDRTIVLVLDHDEDGALGVVINRATPTPVPEAVDRWRELLAAPTVVFEGGPVEPDAVVALGRTSVRVGADDGTAADDHVRLVDLTADPVLEGLELSSVRLFAGYAGWAPGQLEGEIAMGAWFPVDAEPGDVFVADPDGLWQTVLRRQSGDLALLATYPADPSTN
jgi:putative transcriptional regulator